MVYLTFDDGPNPSATPELLDTLKREQVRATFFVVDRHIDESTAPLVRRIFDAVSTTKKSVVVVAVDVAGGDGSQMGTFARRAPTRSAGLAVPTAGAATLPAAAVRLAKPDHW